MYKRQALTPKLVMVTNHWVWHSPFFGGIIRYADFYYVGDVYKRQLILRLLGGSGCTLLTEKTQAVGRVDAVLRCV